MATRPFLTDEQFARLKAGAPTPPQSQQAEPQQSQDETQQNRVILSDEQFMAAKAAAGQTPQPAAPTAAATLKPIASVANKVLGAALGGTPLGGAIQAGAAVGDIVSGAGEIRKGFERGTGQQVALEEGMRRLAGVPSLDQGIKDTAQQMIAQNAAAPDPNRPVRDFVARQAETFAGTAPLMLAGLPLGVGLGGVAAAPVAGAVAGGLSGVAESAIESGAALTEAEQRGITEYMGKLPPEQRTELAALIARGEVHPKAMAVASQVFLGNLPLTVGLNAVEGVLLAAPFIKIPPGIKAALGKTPGTAGLGAAALAGAGVAGQSASEGIQEIGQEAVSQKALDNVPLGKMTPEKAAAFKAGAEFGAAMQLIPGAASVVTSKAQLQDATKSYRQARRAAVQTEAKAEKITPGEEPPVNVVRRPPPGAPPSPAGAAVALPDLVPTETRGEGDAEGWLPGSEGPTQEEREVVRGAVGGEEVNQGVTNVAPAAEATDTEAGEAQDALRGSEGQGRQSDGDGVPPVGQPARPGRKPTGVAAVSRVNSQRLQRLERATAQYLGVPGAKYRVVKARTEDEKQFIRVATELGKAFDADVLVVKTDNAQAAGAWNGVEFDPEGEDTKHSLVLNIDSPNPIPAVAGHEVWHRIDKEAPDLAEPVYTVLKEVADLDTYRRERGLRDWQYAPSEFTGDFLGEQMGNPVFWDKLASRYPKAFVRLARMFLEIVDKIRAALPRNYKVARYLRDTDRLRDAVVEAMAQFRERVDARVEERQRAEDELADRRRARYAEKEARKTDPVAHVRSTLARKRDGTGGIRITAGALSENQSRKKRWGLPEEFEWLPPIFRARKDNASAMSFDEALEVVDEANGWAKGTATIEDLKAALTGPYRAPVDQPSLTAAEERELEDAAYEAAAVGAEPDAGEYEPPPFQRPSWQKRRTALGPLFEPQQRELLAPEERREEPVFTEAAPTAPEEPARPPREGQQRFLFGDITESPKFKSWFGGSKIVDADGKPLVVYHSGTFDERENPVPDINGNGFHFGTKAAAETRLANLPKERYVESIKTGLDEDTGRWWWEADGLSSYNFDEEGYDTEEDARGAAMQYEPDEPEPWDLPITEAFLSIKNPKRVSDQRNDWAPAIKKAKAEGYDGLVYRNQFEDKGSDSYIAFYPTQIKSVYNRGTFSPTEERIDWQTRRTSKYESMPIADLEREIDLRYESGNTRDVARLEQILARRTEDREISGEEAPISLLRQYGYLGNEEDKVSLEYDLASAYSDWIRPRPSRDWQPHGRDAEEGRTRESNFTEGVRAILQGAPGFGAEQSEALTFERAFGVAKDSYERMQRIRGGYMANAGRGAEQLAQFKERFPPAWQTPRQPVWYHKLQRVLKEKLPNRASADQVRGVVKSGGVKDEEVEWSGLTEYLTDHPTVDKAELLAHLRASQIKVTEKVLGGTSDEVDRLIAEHERLGAERQALHDPLRRALQDAGATYQGAATLIREYGRGNIGLDERVLLDYLSEERGVSLRGLAGDRLVDLEEYGRLTREYNRAADQLHDLRREDAPFSQYTLPGGKDYRVLLLTLPEKKRPVSLGPVPEGWEVRRGEDILDEDGNRAGWATENFYVLDGRTDVVGMGATREAAVENSRAAMIVERPIVQEMEQSGYRSGHFIETPNVLAHVRFKERVGENGKRVLFIEEIQSDWHQAGRSKGYGDGLEYRVQVYGELIEIFATEAEANEYADALAERRGMPRERIVIKPTPSKGAVPDAPFKRAWPELAFKRMLRWAVENGFDQVAWTTGEQQAERYDLSKQVDSLLVRRRKTDGKYEVSFGRDTTLRGGQVDDWHIVPGAHTASELPGVIGKELAERVVANPESKQEYSGLDLKVGGEGMKAFYDAMLPSSVNRYVKKWGAEVRPGGVSITVSKGRPAMGDRFLVDMVDEEEPNIYGVFDTTDDEDSPPVFETVNLQLAIDRANELNGKGAATPGYTRVHTLDITEPMRESVMGGQPLWQRRYPEAVSSVTESASFKKWFGESKVVDDRTGEPLVVYHGSFRSFKQFKPGGVEGFMGQGIYFTDEPRDASQNYARLEGPDVRAKIGRATDRVSDEVPNSLRDATARRSVVGRGGGRVYPVYLRIENPVVIGGSWPTVFEYEFNEETGEESGTFVDLYNAFLQAAEEFEVDGESAWSNAEVYAEDTAEEIISKLSGSETLAYVEDPETGDLATSEVIRRMFELAGFDGVIDHKPTERWASQSYSQMRGMTSETTHYVVFSPSQIKSVFNRGTFSTESNRIDWQTRRVAEGQLPLFESPERDRRTEFERQLDEAWEEDARTRPPRERKKARIWFYKRTDYGPGEEPASPAVPVYLSGPMTREEAEPLIRAAAGGHEIKIWPAVNDSHPWQTRRTPENQRQLFRHNEPAGPRENVWPGAMADEGAPAGERGPQWRGVPTQEELAHANRQKVDLARQKAVTAPPKDKRGQMGHAAYAAATKGAKAPGKSILRRFLGGLWDVARGEFPHKSAETQLPKNFKPWRSNDGTWFVTDENGRFHGLTYKDRAGAQTEADRLNRGEHTAEEFAQRAERAWWNGIHYRSTLIDPMWVAWEKLTHADKLWVKHNFVWAYEDKKPMPNPRIQAFADAWREANTWIGKQAQNLGMVVEGAGGQRSLFEPRPFETYVPHRLTDDAREALRNRQGPLYLAIVEAARVNGIPIDVLHELYINPFGSKRHGSLEHERMADLPRTVIVDGKPVKVLEDDPAILGSHIAGAARRLAIVEQFGNEGTADYLRAVGDRMIAEGLTADEAEELVPAIWSRLQGSEKPGNPFGHSGPLRHAWNVLESGTAAANLSLAVVPNLFGGPLPLMVRHGVIRTIRSFVRAYLSPIGSEDMAVLRRLGYLGQDLHRSLTGTDLTSGMPVTEFIEGLPRRAASRALRTTGFQLVNRKINQAVAFAIANDYMRTALGAIRDGRGGALRRAFGKDAETYRKYLREQLGFAQADIDRMVEEGPTDKDMARAIGKEVENVNAMNESPVSRPPHVEKWVWRIFMAYTTYIRKFAKTVEYAVTEAKRGNERPLATLMVGGVVTGEVIQAVRNALKDRDREDEKWWERLLSDFVEVGAFGMWGQVAYAARHLGDYGHDFFSDVFMPPQAEALRTLTGAVAQAVKSGEIRPLWRGLTRVAPATAAIEAQARRLAGDKSAVVERLANMVYTSSGYDKQTRKRRHPLDPLPGKERNVARLKERWAKLGGTEEQLLEEIKASRQRLQPEPKPGTDLYPGWNDEEIANNFKAKGLPEAMKAWESMTPAQREVVKAIYVRKLDRARRETKDPDYRKSLMEQRMAATGASTSMLQ